MDCGAYGTPMGPQWLGRVKTLAENHGGQVYLEHGQNNATQGVGGGMPIAAHSDNMPIAVWFQ